MKFVVVCPRGCEHQKMIVPYRMKYDKAQEKMIPEFIGLAPKCSNCGELMVFQEEESNIPDFSVNAFGGLPDDKKQEILRQRFDKEIKQGAGDEKEFRKRKAMNKMLGKND